ncbi:MAG: hypothetical protein AAGI23_10005 [Bacteroidota bacterium]
MKKGQKLILAIVFIIAAFINGATSVLADTSVAFLHYIATGLFFALAGYYFYTFSKAKNNKKQQSK